MTKWHPCPKCGRTIEAGKACPACPGVMSSEYIDWLTAMDGITNEMLEAWVPLTAPDGVFIGVDVRGNTGRRQGWLKGES